MNKITFILILLFVCSILLIYFNINNKTNDSSNQKQTNNDSIKNKEDNGEIMNLNISVNDKVLSATLVDNSSSRALIEKLKDGDITIDMEDYGDFEKVGPLGFDLPRNDASITTAPGDIILYQGNMITIYYDKNSWNFTKLGKINNISSQELKDILGDGNVTITISLN